MLIQSRSFAIGVSLLAIMWAADAAARAQGPNAIGNMKRIVIPDNSQTGTARSGSSSSATASSSKSAPSQVPVDSRIGPIGDRDCADFRTQAEAQAFFRAAGPGDPHRLDRDGDGLACELNGR